MNQETVNVNGTEVAKEGVVKMADGNVAVVVHHIVGEDGLTDKQRNTAKEHTIPLYTLVEIGGDTTSNGLRLYVQGHSRDCDGTPLYDLTFDYEVVGEDLSSDALRHIRDTQDPYTHVFAVVASGSIVRHYSAESLTIIKTADEVKKSLIDSGYLDEKAIAKLQ